MDTLGWAYWPILGANNSSGLVTCFPKTKGLLESRDKTFGDSPFLDLAKGLRVQLKPKNNLQQTFSPTSANTDATLDATWRSSNRSAPAQPAKEPAAQAPQQKNATGTWKQQTLRPQEDPRCANLVVQSPSVFEKNSLKTHIYLHQLKL